jgi:pimeloyl-ACP methyl ester carboxylesterase
MATEPLLQGITAGMVQTSRLRTHVLTAGPAQGEPVVLVHGNVSSARFFEELMLALAPRYWVLAPDLRGYGESETAPVDATRGLRDFSDDLAALIDTLQLPPFHLLGWSMGGGIAMQYVMEHPSQVSSLILVSGMSPYGFGGTRDVAGALCHPDAAGSGGGTANPEFVRLLHEGDRSAENPVSPRNVMLQFYFKPPFRPAPEREEVFVSAMLDTKIGPANYPGDLTQSPNWPAVAPGRQGVNNALAPVYCDLSAFGQLANGPRLLWVRGDADQIVSDTSLFDFGFLGQIGAVPDWPGADLYPPQPMVAQLRAVLAEYGRHGASVRELVVRDAGHSPFIERPAEFQDALLRFLADNQAMSPRAI